MTMQVFRSFHWTNAMLCKRWQHYAHICTCLQNYNV